MPLKNKVIHVMNDDAEALEEKVMDPNLEVQNFYKSNGQVLMHV